MIYDFALFDLDGTLTDPALGITNSVMYALSNFGISADDRRELYKFIGPPLLYSFETFFGFSREESQKALSYYREYFSEKGIFENEKYEGIDALLSSLKAQGTKIVLATSKPDVYAEKILEHFDIAEYFYFISGNTLSESRPEKTDVIEYAIKNCGIKDTSHAIMTGDRKYDISGAKAFGLVSVGVSYGYGSEEELKDAGADFIAATVAELSGILAGGQI